MTSNGPRGRGNQEFWREFLTQGHRPERVVRRFFARIPHEPRCKICAAPFAGMGAPLMRLIGKRQSDKSPNMCTSCFKSWRVTTAAPRSSSRCSSPTSGGRRRLRSRCRRPSSTRSSTASTRSPRRSSSSTRAGSTSSSATSWSPCSFRCLPAKSTRPERSRQPERSYWRQATAVQKGRGCLSGPGVHTGLAWMGAVGEDPHIELTAVGDAVNIAARLASVASAGEVLVSADAARAAGLDPQLKRHHLELKGKQLTTEVVSLRLGDADELVSPGPDSEHGSLTGSGR